MNAHELPRRFQDQIAAQMRPRPAPVVAKSATTPVTPKVSKPKRKGRMPRTRNGGKWTESGFWGHLRSGLRRTFRFWQPAILALNGARVACKGPRGRKWAYLCAACNKLHLRKNVQIDHIAAVGELRNPDHIAPWIARLTAEDPKAFQVLCRTCHQSKTNAERDTP